MRIIFVILILTATVVFSISCGWSAAENNANANVETIAPVENKSEAPIYTDAETALAEGNKLFEENKTEAAIEAYKQAVKLNPDLAEAHFKLGISYALIESEQELVVTPAEPSESNSAGKKEKKEKKTNSEISFENAVKAYEKIIREDPKNAVAYFNLGRALNLLNEDEDSRKALEKAVKLNPDDTQYQTEFGSILMKLAQYDEAVRALKKALELDKANAQAEDLLVKAEAGKKRVDFGADKLKDRLKDSNQQQPPPPGTGKKREAKDDKNTNKAEPEKKTDPEKTIPSLKV